jgi:hypothetical protein
VTGHQFAAGSVSGRVPFEGDRSVDNPNDVTVSHDFKTSEAAKAFASSLNLKNAMQNAGVKSAPQIWFVIPADK